MKAFRTFLILLVVAGTLVGGLTVTVTNWSRIFAKRVKGRVINVERVTDPNAIISSRVTEGQLHSYAILLQGDDGKFYTASSEDRQWQVVKKGYCVEALLYVYPPWEMSKANTYFNARLDGLFLCPGETQLPGSEPAAPSPEPTVPSKEPAAPPSEAPAH